jgi:hypothetical protein
LTMSRIRVNIDQLVLKGFDPAERKALVEGLHRELSRVLSDATVRSEWAFPHRTPVLKLGGMPFEPGPSGSRKFGGSVARGIGKGLEP